MNLRNKLLMSLYSLGLLALVIFIIIVTKFFVPYLIVLAVGVFLYAQYRTYITHKDTNKDNYTDENFDESV